MKTDQPTWIIYQGPPTWDGSKWVNGDRFFLSGPKAYRANLGVELAPGMDGLELPVTEYRYDADANTPGLAEGEVAKLDYNPKNPTFLKRQKNGTIVNLWPSMVGQRPRFCLEPQTMNTLEIRHVTDETRSGDGLPRLKYSPEFTSWT